MPEDLPKAVLVLLWLLSGTIIFGALLMNTSWINSGLFLLVFFGIPVLLYWLVYKSRQRKKAAAKNDLP